jgi:hypothetical protein
VNGPFGGKNYQTELDDPYTYGGSSISNDRYRLAENAEKARETGVGKTQFGLPIDYSFSKPASEEQIQRAATALRAHNIAVEVVDTPAAARAYVNSILPKDQNIFTSVTTVCTR